jgi:hypothetical protein
MEAQITEILLDHMGEYADDEDGRAWAHFVAVYIAAAVAAGRL